VLRFSRKSKAASTLWATELLERKPGKVAAVALANKMARIVWALMTKETSFRTAMN
jgi:transposase